MDKEEKIKDAFDKFEDGKFTDAEDELRKVFRKTVNDHLKDKLELKNDVLDIKDDDGGDKNEE